MKSFVKKLGTVMIIVLSALLLFTVTSKAVVSQEEKDKYPYDYGASEVKTTEDGLKYYTMDYATDAQESKGVKGGAKIVGTTNESTKALTIPAKIGEYEVTGIWYYAFADMTSLERVIFNAGVSVSDGAFMGCTNLKEVQFNEPVMLYDSIFSGTAIESLKFPGDSAMYVNAFEGMNKLKSIYFTDKANAEENPFLNALWDHDVDGNTGILSETTKQYLAKNVTVYGYSVGSEWDKDTPYHLTPKGFAIRYGMKFADLGIEKAIPDEIKLDIKESEILAGGIKELNASKDGEKKVLEALKEAGYDSKQYTANVCILMDKGVRNARVTVFDKDNNVQA